MNKLKTTATTTNNLWCGNSNYYSVKSVGLYIGK